MAKKSARQPRRVAERVPPNPDGQPGHLDQVREILFGEHVRLYEERLARLEKHLLQENVELRDATDARFDALESHLRHEVEALGKKLKGAEVDRTEALKKLGLELKATGKHLEKEIGKLDDGTSRIASDLRKHTAEQVKALSVQLREQANTLTALLERKFDELRAEKADRVSLAALFAEMAARLSDEQHSDT